MYDVIIIGSGPAGLSAGIYAMRARLNTVMLEKGYVNGGQVLNTYEVDNYPGMPGVTGMELSESFVEHARKLQLEIKRGEVTGIRKEEDHFCVETPEEIYETSTVILATGARHRMLEVPGEEELTGMGVSYCATCDGAFFADKTVAVVGGGDVALEDALLLARSCEKVYLIHRRDALRGTQMLQEKVKNTANIEIVWNTVVDEIQGSDQVSRLKVRNVKTDEIASLEVEGVFVAVGILPNSDAFADLTDLDAGGYILAEEDCATSVPGIFAAGDVRTKQLRQIVTAVADGACAIASVERYLLEK